MAEIKKYLDLDGLKKVFGIVDEKISGATATVNAEVAKKADKTELEAYLTKTEAEGTYIKEHQSLAEYAKKSELEGLASESYVDSAISDVKDEILSEDLSEALETLETVKNWKEEHGTEYTNLLAEVNKKANASEVYTKGETDAKIAEVIAGSVDLEPYAKSAEVAETYATKAQLEGYQTKGDYALKSELPSVKGLASESYVNGKVAEVEGKIPTTYVKSINLDGNEIQYYPNTNFTPNIISLAYINGQKIVGGKESYINFQLATKDEIANFITEADLPTFVAFTDSEIEGAANA